jgi:signal transduction histidine kinase/ligand-binding sensor domain-containing protein/DNA-binding response OmpR family regulator
MNKKGIVFCFLLLYLLIPFALVALEPDKAISQYSVRVWDMDDGLPGNSVFVIRQTQNGYLWLGTQDGPVRFDGVNFELISNETTHFKGREIRALLEDSKGVLWIGTSAGGLFRYKDGVFKPFSVSGHKFLAKIRAIEEDSEGNLWIGSLKEGLTCLCNDIFTTYSQEDGLPSKEVYSIYKDDNDVLWATFREGIVRITGPKKFETLVNQKDIPDIFTCCLYNTDSRELWIGTGSKGLFRWKNDKFKHFGPEAGIPNQSITYFCEDKDKNLWIGTDGGGLIRMKDGVFTTLSVGEGLADDDVHSMYQDREGNLWVGTLDGGLHRFSDGKFTTYTIKEGLAHDYSQVVIQNKTGDILIGTKGGLNLLKKRQLTSVLTSREGLLNNSVVCLLEDNSGILWIGTWGGLHRLANGKLTSITTKDGLPDDRIESLFEDRHGNIWVGTEKGLSRIDKNSGKIYVLSTKKGPFKKTVHFIYEDTKGNLLVGTTNGLHRIEEGAITAVTPASGMENYFYECIYEDKEGVLWLGTHSGLIRWKEDKPVLYTTQCGLDDNYVTSILEDEKGNLWLAGRNGISKISKKKLQDFTTGTIGSVHPVSYNERDGMKSGWCTGPGFETQDGRFWFPTSVGVTTIDPNHIKENELEPTLIIEKFIVDDKSIDINKTLELEPGKKRLEIHYTGVSFINPQKIRFKLKLEGYDEDWVAAGGARSIVYSGLSPGRYTFRMKACNSDGVWSKEEESFSFYLKPYFYQTTWFFILSGLFVLVSAFSVYRFRVRLLKHRQKELAQLVDVRTKDLKERNIDLENARQKIQHSKELIETKNLQLESQTVQLKEQAERLKEMDKVKSRFFANISHEFRTPLTLIMGPLEQMLSYSNDESQKKRINLMLRNSQRLLRLINQLLELSKFESGKVKLRASLQNVVPLLKGVLANFEPLADQNELEFLFQSKENDISLYIDTEKLEDIITNLVINAVKFTPPGGKITVAAEHVQTQDEVFPHGFLRLSISDTGTGIPREQLSHIFDRFYQTDSTHENRQKGSGIGLALVKELVQLHHGKIDVYSREGKGTEFIIKLHLGDEHLEAEEIVEPGVRVDVSGVPADIKGVRVDVTGVPVGKKEVGAHITTAVPEDAIEETSEETDDEIIDTPEPGKEIILVVEDSADVREYIRGSLEPLYTVIEAKDGEEGCRKSLEYIPDLIISDIMMPVMDGYELCEKLKADIRTSHIPIILLTAKASEESTIKGLETGVDDYVTKPFNTRILLARIKNLIDLRRQLQMDINREMTMQPAKIAVASIDKEFLKDLKEVIRKNLEDPEFNVERLADKLYMDRSTVYRKILAITGESPTEFIRSCRLRRGAELLKNNFGTVLEVALEVGFSSANYFTKCFKKKFHQLPSEYQAAESAASASRD